MDWNNKEEVLVEVKDCGYALKNASTELQEELRNGLG